jgi:hypothetical protein
MNSEADMTQSSVSEERIRRIAFKAAEPYLPGGTMCFNAIEAALNAITNRLRAEGMRKMAHSLRGKLDPSEYLDALARADDMDGGAAARADAAYFDPPPTEGETNMTIPVSAYLPPSYRCVDGRRWRHDPQPDDPYLETDRGECPECGGKGCNQEEPTHLLMQRIAQRALK